MVSATPNDCGGFVAAAIVGHDVPTCDVIQFHRRGCMTKCVGIACASSAVSRLFWAPNSFGHSSATVGEAEVYDVA